MTLAWVRKDDNPRVLIVTPLKTGDTIDPRTIMSVVQGSLGVPIHWVSYEGDMNIPANTNAGIQAYEMEVGPLPEYFIKVDNDIIDVGGSMISSMVQALDAAGKNVAYSYLGVTYFDEEARMTKAIIEPREFDPISLLKANYISSNSLIRSSVLKDAGLFVDDDRYVRLLDWAFWIKLMSLGYIGKVAGGSTFIALYTPGSVSAGTVDDYIEKRKRIYEDFIKGVDFKGVGI